MTVQQRTNRKLRHVLGAVGVVGKTFVSRERGESAAEGPRQESSITRDLTGVETSVGLPFTYMSLTYPSSPQIRSRESYTSTKSNPTPSVQTPRSFFDAPHD